MESITGWGMKWSSARGRARIPGRQNSARKDLWKRVLGVLNKPFRPAFSWIDERILFNYFTTRIIQVANDNNVDIIHAHVPYRVGMPALKAARKLGVPFVYEMRGMWEESAVASGRWRAGGLAHRRFRRIETKVMRNADAVICISETLGKEAESRGISPERITIVPNAVNPHPPEPENSELHASVKEKIGNSTVVGYIGSLRELEGVDFTADAVSILRKRGLDTKLFVLSSESGQPELRTHCERLGIGDHAIITGPVPHDQVAPFYNLIDVFVVSRPDKRVTQLVTPLKPFEAMQAGRALVMSDLPALAEIIEDGKTGRLTPPGDIGKLADTIEELLHDEPKRIALGVAAAQWVSENRTWSKVVSCTPEIYHRLLQDSGR
jgi:glycosyltransferase involved in cell wall biosynthesis